MKPFEADSFGGVSPGYIDNDDSVSALTVEANETEAIIDPQNHGESLEAKSNTSHDNASKSNTQKREQNLQEPALLTTIATPAFAEKEIALQATSQCLSYSAIVANEEEICSTGLTIWCKSNDFGPRILSALRDQGVESVNDILELSETDRCELVEVMDLKFVEKKKLGKALSTEVLQLYEKCTLQQSNSVVYLKQKAEVIKSMRDVNKVDRNATMDKQLAEKIESTAGHPNRPIFPPGLHMVPHKIIVLDRQKAMKDNPALKPEDFMSLTSDGFKCPPGGELKVVLFVGATGSGKSTTINSYVNYLYGVSFDDQFRLHLVTEPPTIERKNMSSSQTDQVFGYLLETPPAFGGKDSLLIIDTPGFGDTRGIERDMQTIRDIKAFFNMEINYLHAVSFVVQGNATRLDTRNRWIFDQVLSLFGKDISDIITLLMTFSDAAEPPAMAVINEAKIGYVERFKLNNSAFIMSNRGGSDHDRAVNELFWSVGQCAFEAFSKFCLTSKEQSLKETKSVLDQRDRLKCGIENVRQYIAIGLATLEQLETTIPAIIQCQTLIDSNKHFEFVVTEMETVKRPKESRYNTVCVNCSWTCHENCMFANDCDKMRCSAMSRPSGHCKHCPNKCDWSSHQNLDYYYTRVPVKKTQTNKEFYDRYVSASSEKSKFDQILDGLRAEFEAAQVSVFEAVREIQNMINALQEIALRPSIYHNDEYFDIMIECERKDKQQGWKERIKAIKDVQERAKLCHDVKSEGYDPFATRVSQVRESAMKGKIEVFVSNPGAPPTPHKPNSNTKKTAKKSSAASYFSWLKNS